LALVVTKLNDEIEHFQLEHEIIKWYANKLALLLLRNVVIVNDYQNTFGKPSKIDAQYRWYDQIPSTIDDEAIVEEISFW
jgi:propionyl-CoA synthetase